MSSNRQSTSGAAEQAVLAPRLQWRSLLASSAGNWLEWFEWMAYAALATFISGAMFDADNEASGLLGTFAIFFVGFLMRPLGGIVFGRIADRRGRKFVLILTMMIMSLGSFVIAFIPGFDRIGIAASAVLLIVRLAQGFAHGGESATAYAYAAEIAPPDRRGQWGSVVFMSIFGGSVLAFGLSGTLTATLGEDAVAEWAWRIPFAVAGVLCLVVLWLRRGMEETPSFTVAQHEAEGADAVAAQAPPVANHSPLRAIVLIVMLVSGLTAAHYTWSSYVATYAMKAQNMDANTALWTTTLVQGLMVVAIPFLGRISDRIGRRPVYIASGVLMALAQYPMMSLIGSAWWSLAIASTVSLLVVCLAGSSLSAYMSEQFATHRRSQGIGIAYSLSVAVFGGSAPYLNQLFIDSGWAGGPSAYVVVLCVFSTIAAIMLPETRGVSLTGRKD